jgi:hypothetical protein
MSISTGIKNDLRNIIAKMSVQDRKELIEELTQSLRKRREAPEGEELRENVRKLLEKIEAMPSGSPDDGFSGKDHDKILYGDSK